MILVKKLALKQIIVHQYYSKKILQIKKNKLDNKGINLIKKFIKEMYTKFGNNMIRIKMIYYCFSLLNN